VLSTRLSLYPTPFLLWILPLSINTSASSITRNECIYFAAVGLLALYVGVWGYFIPGMVDEAIPWLVPPLHARFLGAMYFSGLAFMIGCLRARRWSDVRIVVPMIGIWTGMLLIVSFFYLPEFDFSRAQVWIWFAAYVAYPLIALWLAWQHRADPDEASGAPLPGWTRAYLIGQGVVLTLLALALLFAPAFMVTVWPWAITPMLAQIYAAPFLSYGIGSLLHARRQTWTHIRIAVTAFTMFAVLILIASVIHLTLFSSAEVSDVLWFAGFIVAALANGALALSAFNAGRQS
jgi:hypothetical protein